IPLPPCAFRMLSLTLHPAPRSTLCPYTTLFRSRLGQPIVASVCLHKNIEGQFLVLSPCGICQERLVMHGTGTLVGVPNKVPVPRSEEHTSELQSRFDIVCRLLLEKKK